MWGVIPQTMKTPERWHALWRLALFVSIPALRPSNTHYIKCYVIRRCNVMAWCHMTLWCHGVTSYDVLCHGREIVQSRNHLKLQNSHFSTWWPWLLTLTFKLIQDIIKVNLIMGPYVKRFSRECIHRHPDTQTDGTDSIPSTADAGGNEHSPSYLSTSV